MRYGTGKYTYELVDPWAKLPEGESLVDVCGISIDSDDRVYVFNRSHRPMIVFDRDGNEVSHWGEGLFKRPHGSCLTADDHLWVADDNGHVVHKFTKEGKLVMTLGEKGRPCGNGYRLGGLDVLKQIKRDYPNTQIILLTGHGSTKDGIKGMRLGAFDYLMKPVNIEDLIQKMNEAFQAMDTSQS